MQIRLLFVGDIVGEPGRLMVRDFVPKLRQQLAVDFVIANGENMAGGFGITPETFQEITQAGVDVVTGGNHTFDKKEGIPVLESEPFVLRPANYPAKTPGRGWCTVSNQHGKKIAVINVMGRVFMDPLDCPFAKVDELLAQLPSDVGAILVDFHAEATSEKVAMGWHLDGRASFVVGTHTHIPTGDARILPQGTAYLTDAGMTGPYDSVIGVKKEIIVSRFVTRRGRKFETASGDPWLCGAVVTVDAASRRAIDIQSIRIERSRPETHSPSRLAKSLAQ
jgi:metallophosphoesterase (TIGR00282 family)